MKKSLFFTLAASAMLLASCSKEPVAQLTKSGLNPADFKTDSTALYVLTNKNGMEVCITNYGGRIVSIMVPDKSDSLRDVVLGFDNVASYLPENNKTDRLRGLHWPLCKSHRPRQVHPGRLNIPTYHQQRSPLATWWHHRLAISHLQGQPNK